MIGRAAGRRPPMSRPKPAKPAKLVVGLFLADRQLLAALYPRLAERFGPADIVSPWWPFDRTDYYAAEMGAPLFRRLIAFERLVAQEGLAAVKHGTNALEDQFAAAGRRRVNIDPGLLLLERFVLATGKNFSHRICIGQDIYADLTLIYERGAWRPLPWTYPDYAGGALGGFLLAVRRKYAAQLAAAAPADAQPPGRPTP